MNSRVPGEVRFLSERASVPMVWAIADFSAILICSDMTSAVQVMDVPQFVFA